MKLFIANRPHKPKETELKMLTQIGQIKSVTLTTNENEKEKGEEFVRTTVNGQAEIVALDEKGN